MDELRLIIEALETLGENGREVFFWWLIFDKLVPGLIFLAAFVIAASIFVWALRVTNTNSRSYDVVRDMRDALGVGHPGYLTPAEIEQVKRSFEEMMARRKP